MIDIGFIGFGSMGSMFVKGFIKSGDVCPEHIIVTRKNKNRLEEIKDIWPDINITWDVTEVARKAKYIFICVEPLEFQNILDEIKPFIQMDQHIISTVGAVPIEYMERFVNCKITRVMPTILSEVNEGFSLVCHNSQVTTVDAGFIESLLGVLSKIKRIDEKDLGLAMELTSCGPGFIASVFQEFIEAAIRRNGNLSKEDTAEMVLQTIYGTTKLMLKRKMDFEEVISRVATKGGITEEGVKVLREGLPEVFDEMFEKTLKKRKSVSERVNMEV